MEMEFGEGGAQKSASAESREQNKLSDSIPPIQPTGDLTIDGLGQIRRIIQNKIRNLEKKKAKLETYKEQLASGKELTEDQKAASGKLDEAERSIETQRDFLKIIQSVQNDYCKQLKTHKKKEEREKQQVDINRFRDLLRYQDVLNTLGNDEVRQDFLDGAKASVKCSKEEMALYDDMYKKLCPASEDATDWAKALDESALFGYRLVTGAPKTATGFENVTFQQLKETLDNIAFCPYFHGKSTQSSVPLKQAEPTVELAEEPEHRPVEPTNSFDSSERSATPTMYVNTSAAPNNAPAGIPNGNNQPQPQQQTVLPPPSAPPQQNQMFMTANDILASTHLTTINFLQEDQTDSRSAAVGVDYVSMVSSGAISQPSLNFNMHTGQDRNGDSQELVNNNEYQSPQEQQAQQQQQPIQQQQFGRGGGSYRGRFQKEGGYRGGRGMGGRGGGFYGGGRDRGGRGGGNFRGGYGGPRGGSFGNDKFGAAGAGNFKESGATKA